jgi:hypothetical protein
LPPLKGQEQWERLFDTAIKEPEPSAKAATDKGFEGPKLSDPYKLQPCSMAVFTAPAPERKEEASPVTPNVR